MSELEIKYSMLVLDMRVHNAFAGEFILANVFFHMSKENKIQIQL